MFLALIMKFGNQPSADAHIIETYVHLKLELNICICVCYPSIPVCVCVCPLTGHIKALFIALLSLMTDFAGH